MKKLYLFLIISWLFTQNTTFGFLSESDGLDLYKKIDSGYYELNLKYLEKEMKGDENSDQKISTQLNSIAKQKGLKECFGGDIKASDVKNINQDENGAEQMSKFLSKCIEESETKSISLDELTKYYEITNQFYKDSESRAQDKVKNIHQIGKIGLYSDGIAENSPFDLIVDLQNIDGILFETSSEYNGTNNVNLGKAVNDILNGKKIDEAVKKASYTTPQKETITRIIQNDGNSNVCKINESGLDNSVVDKILGNQKIIIQNEKTITNSAPKSDISQNNYKKQTDNDIWPCNTFFCIKVKFIVTNHSLLGGAVYSVEGLLKRSNSHLKKSNNSLIQAKMGTNIFELSLKDFDLTKMASFGVFLSQKPVPFLTLDKEAKRDGRDESDFSSENLLKRYYSNLGMDYNRLNDLDIFTQKENDIKTTLSTEGTDISLLSKRAGELSTQIKDKIPQNDYVGNVVIDNKVSDDTLKTFNSQFTELENFVSSIVDYSFGFQSSVKKMDSIPNSKN